ncbi:hypothetical protein K8Z61_06500 [Nocardioides sp. TRM66260-LWL]|uniref:hypothetical protein n=1 Tax=Nocardioides sp. TRM66260-LWL TaxID=2874478 RepID=UPI001CC78891|nr:hypothetical protein [Nocardioides sp. TRM66260-LWL]MBZ5734142.1 hypothetical protein [Nocardioides sp. TRM66260-LWL]
MTTTGGRILQCLPPRLDGARIELPYLGVASDGVRTSFVETVELPGPLDGADPAVVEPLLRLLSLAASLSYAKAYAPGAIEVPDGLTAQERAFLAELTPNGLGEFAYVNDLPEVFSTPILGPDRAAPAAPAAPSSPDAGSASHRPGRVLVAVGGGKDSIVSIEALLGAGLDVGLFSVNAYAPIEATAQVAERPLHTARRRLDPELFRLNAEGAPNGHVPVTAVNSLVAVLTALALGFDTVVFSNEASSSYGNVAWHGRVVNHQWSKGLAFERLLRASLPTGAPDYVSLLRPLTELRIARRFAEHRAYHGVFTSCNRAFKLQESERTSWCGDCPKCRFVFLCLGPFLPREELLAIFSGRDLFADPAQREGFLELLGAEGLLKPFECVGEPDECRVALGLLRAHPDWTGHPFLERPEVATLAAGADEAERVFAFHEDEHCLGPALEAIARAV